MSDNYQTPHTGDTLFEAFVEQVKQVLEHLYDFAYLQQHPLARIYDSESDLSAKTAGRQLRYELMTVIESFKPGSDAYFRAPEARLYSVLHLYYVENLTIQEVASELGLSERQAYRDLHRSQESVAAVLWDKRLPSEAEPTPQPEPQQDFSLASEVARLKLNFSPVDVSAIFRQALQAVERLAQQQGVEIVPPSALHVLTMSTDPALAHQTIVSALSSAVQQADRGALLISSEAAQDMLTLTLHYRRKEGSDPAAITDSVAAKLAQRLQWAITAEDFPDGTRRIVLQMASRKVTILVIDDNQSWIELLSRFLESDDCLVVPLPAGRDTLEQVQQLRPSAIILDVMMPEQDGWELLQRLRTQPTTRDIPILVCTVFDDSQLAYSLGASGFVLKPANRGHILDALQQLNVL